MAARLSGQPLPLIGGLLGESNAPGGVIAPEFYNQLGAMHGTIMVFLGIVPLAFGAFGNYVVPLQIGAPDMAFPRLNVASYWLYLAGGLVMLVSFFVPGGAANNGWTSYAPLSDIAPGHGQTLWLVGMLLLIFSSLLGRDELHRHHHPAARAGHDLVPAALLRLGAVHHRVPAAARVSGAAGGGGAAGHGSPGRHQLLPAERAGRQPASRSTVAGGGNALLWQHLFWFLGHPEVYVLILPAMGIIAEVIANNTRKPLWGYRLMVYSIFVLGFLSFVVWAHHMFLTGMGTTISAFFQATTMIISIPSVIILSALILSLYGGSIRFNTPMLFALAFMPMFGLGGLTGLPLGSAATDIPLHDTNYVVGHFHYLVAPGTIFALFAGIYYWFPKITGRMMNETLGRIHFVGSLVCMNVIFLPMFIQGLAGVNRRLWDGGALYTHAQEHAAR